MGVVIDYAISNYQLSSQFSIVHLLYQVITVSSTVVSCMFNEYINSISNRLGDTVDGSEIPFPTTWDV